MEEDIILKHNKIPRKRKVLCAVMGSIAALFLFPGLALAAPEAPKTQLEYVDEIIVSAYYPAEDAAYPNNYKGVPLSELVGEIVAVPTGSELIGKHILIEYERDGQTEYLLRKVADTGCKAGRIDLLVMDEAAMREWGLRKARIYVIESQEIIQNAETKDTGTSLAE